MNTAAQIYRRASQQSQRQALTEDHLFLVRHVVGRLARTMPNHVDVDNLIGAGNLGLVQAVHDFDPERGVKFKTYASIRIRGAIYDELRRNCPLPQAEMERIQQVSAASEQLSGPATPEQIAGRTGLTIEDVEQALESMKLLWFDTWDTAFPLVDPTSESHSPMSDAEAEELQNSLADGIESLPERERLAIQLYYLEDLRLKEIGDVLTPKIRTEGGVSKLLSKAIERLKHHLNARGQL